MKTWENVIKYYDFKIENDFDDKRILFGKQGDREKRKMLYVHKSEQPYYFIFDNIVSNNKEADILASEGKIFKITGIEIYQRLLGWSNEEALFKSKRYDIRTKNYLDKIKNNCGFINTSSGWDKEEINIEFSFHKYMNTSEIEVGKLGNGKWVAQYFVQTEIDDYTWNKLYFTKKPTQKNIKDIIDILSLEFAFLTGDLGIEFTCWECGCKKHWLDMQGNLSEKIKRFKDKYCGC